MITKTQTKFEKYHDGETRETLNVLLYTGTDEEGDFFHFVAYSTLWAKDDRGSWEVVPQGQTRARKAQVAYALADDFYQGSNVLIHYANFVNGLPEKGWRNLGTQASVSRIAPAAVRTAPLPHWKA